MRKYFTWRCIGLHALVLVLVPAFLVAGWWQYNVALSGNNLSWVYTFEWPFFAVYAIYVWWKLIHDKSTSFDRLWVAKQRAAADAEGRPLHKIPGWATDKALSREVYQATRDAARRPALAGPSLEVRDAQARKAARLNPAASDRPEGPDAGSTSPEPAHASDNDLDGQLGSVINARVLEVKVDVDEELDAYNRFLFELSRSGPPKRWGARPRKRHDDSAVGEAPKVIQVETGRALPRPRGT